MADLGNVLSAATEYGNAREAEGRAEERETSAAQIAELNARLIELNAQLLDATEETQELRDRIATHVAEINRLNAVYAEHMRTVHGEDPDPDPDPEPEPTDTLLGTSYGGADESKNHGRAEVARIFFQGNCPSDPFADADYRKAYSEGVRHFVFSWKGNQTGAQIEACFDNIPDGVTAYGCYWHEPEDNIPSSMSLASWTARHKEHAAAMRRKGVIPVTILMQYTLAASSGRDVTDYFVGDDGFMFDYYMNPAKGKDNPEGAVDKMIEAGRAAGAKWIGLGEAGTPNSVAPATAISLVKRLRAKLVNEPYVRLACYWPSAEFVFQSEAHADAWFEG